MQTKEKTVSNFEAIDKLYEKDKLQ